MVSTGASGGRSGPTAESSKEVSIGCMSGTELSNSGGVQSGSESGGDITARRK